MGKLLEKYDKQKLKYEQKIQAAIAEALRKTRGARRGCRTCTRW